MIRRTAQELEELVRGTLAAELSPASRARMASLLAWLVQLVGRWDEAAALIEGLDPPDVRSRVDLLGIRSMDLRHRGQYRESLEALTQAARELGESEHRHAYARVLQYRSMTLYDTDSPDAYACAAEAAEVFEAAGDWLNLRAARNVMVMALRAELRHAETAEMLHTQLHDAVRMGDREVEAWVRERLGALFLDLGEYDKAEQHSLSAVALYKRQGRLGRAAHPNTHLARSYIGQGRLDEALALIHQTLRAPGLPRDGALTLETLIACVHTLRGAPDEAIAWHNQALDRRHPTTLDSPLAFSLAMRAVTHLRAARLDAAAADLAEARTLDPEPYVGVLLEAIDRHRGGQPMTPLHTSPPTFRATLLQRMLPPRSR